MLGIIRPFFFAAAFGVLSVSLAADVPNPGAETLPKMPPLKELFDVPLRDTSVHLAPDGFYYLVGTTGAPTWWTTNEGIRMWKSKDLLSWEDMGYVWTLEKDATWAKAFDAAGRRAVWAPEIHYIHDTFWIAYSMNYAGGGCGLLKSTTGKPQGPYVDVKPDGPITHGIDASLFVDDDGTVYFVWQDGRVAPMNKEMNGLAEPPRILEPANCVHVGFEGAFLFKAGGKYWLSCAEVNGQGKAARYDCMLASSDNLYGPYSARYLAIPSGGHNTFFQDKDKNWWATYFGSDEVTPVRERAALLRVEVGADEKIWPKSH